MKDTQEGQKSILKLSNLKKLSLIILTITTIATDPTGKLPSTGWDSTGEILFSSIILISTTDSIIITMADITVDITVDIMEVILLVINRGSADTK